MTSDHDLDTARNVVVKFFPGNPEQMRDYDRLVPAIAAALAKERERMRERAVKVADEHVARWFRRMKDAENDGDYMTERSYRRVRDALCDVHHAIRALNGEKQGRGDSLAAALERAERRAEMAVRACENSETGNWLECSRFVLKHIRAARRLATHVPEQEKPS